MHARAVLVAADALDRMTSALGVPRQFFSLPLTETHDGFFRSLRRTSVSHGRRARALAHIAHDLAVTAGTPGLWPVSVPQIPVTGLQAPREELEEAAGQVRQAFRLPKGPVQNTVGMLEKHGILVIRLPLDTADVDAFSLPFHDRPVVVLGTDKNDRARSRFDAAHELGHLVVHGDQIWGVKEVEHQAHEFAAGFLMPAEDIADELPDRADWPALFQLKQKWQVSLAALLMRARTLGRMNRGVRRLCRRPRTRAAGYAIDWVDRFDGTDAYAKRRPKAPATWQQLQADIETIPAHIGTASHVAITGSFRLAPAFTVGAALRMVTSTDIAVMQRGTPWPSDAAYTAPATPTSTAYDIGQGQDIAIAIEVATTMTADVQAFLQDQRIPVGRLVVLEPPGGPRDNAVAGPEQACALAVGLGDAARRAARGHPRSPIPRRTNGPRGPPRPSLEPHRSNYPLRGPSRPGLRSSLYFTA